VFSSADRRTDADTCPGALRLHNAADGPLARIRLPGGRLTGAQLRALRELAEEFGDGQAELTSRANLQLRALTGLSPETLASRLRTASLLPSDTHELVRNILASPLPDWTAPLPVDLGKLLPQLDQALCADLALAALPGRFLFALDSGALDVAAQADVAAVPARTLGGRPGEVAILFAGIDAGLRVPADETVPALLTAAHSFLAEQATQAAEGERASPATRADPATPASPAQPPVRSRAEEWAGDRARAFGQAGFSRAWRVRELVDGPNRVAVRTAAALGVVLGTGGAVPDTGRRELVGVLVQPGGLVAVGAAVPLGRLSGVQMKVVEEAAAIVVTPWRGVVLPGLTPQAARQWARALAGAGLDVHSGSRWAGVTACAGQPGCAKSLADVRTDASAAARAGAGGLPVHWVGCARGCGSPAGPHVRVEATGSGYTVRAPGSSGFATGVEVGELVAAARSEG
jgi:precorrin-3B synthase